jgi:hypothetical protein
MSEKKFHVYFKDMCIYHSLTEIEFLETWKMLNNFISIISDVNKSDLSYEEVLFKKEVSLNSSH